MSLKSINRNSAIFSGLLLLGVFVTTLGMAMAQGGIESSGTGGRHSIQGRLVFPSGQRADLRLKIRLESSGFGDLSVLSDSNGAFTFRSLVPGNYKVVVEGGDYFETTSESVYIESGTVSSRRMPGTIPMSRPFTVQIYLREKAQAAANKPGVLNAALAGIPKQATQFYVQAMDLAARGDNERSISLLQQAVTAYPNFGLAFNELGVLYAKVGDVDKSGEAFRSAIRLSPEAYQPNLNYGIALLNGKKYAEAAVQIREALRKNESAFLAHMYLGIVLINLKNFAEAEGALQKSIALSGGKLGQAHYYLGGLYWRAKDYKRAAEELEKYVQLEPKAVNAERVKGTIKDLRHKS